MSATQLLADLARAGIRLVADGLSLRYSPRSAVNDELFERMKTHKIELLESARRTTEAPTIDLINAAAVWQVALDRLQDDPLFPPDVIAALRTGDAEWRSEAEQEPLGPDGWPLSVVDPNELTPCPNCGTLEQWQSIAGDWCCMRCDPGGWNDWPRNGDNKSK